MLKVKRVCLPLIAVPLGACVAVNPSSEPAIPFAEHFSYSITDRARIHLVQVFDDGSDTYLQFDQLPDPIEIRRSNTQAPIDYRVDPHYLVIPGLYGEFRVQMGENSSMVTHLGNFSASALSMTHSAKLEPMGVRETAAPYSAHATSPANDDSHSTPYPPEVTEPVPAAVQAAPVGVPEGLQTMNAKLLVSTLKQEISLLEERVRFLSEELEEAHRTGSGAMLYLRQLGGLPRIAVKFDDNSAEVKIDDALLGALGNTVRAANRIYLHGHTDAFVASAAGTQLAIRRAVEVRHVLASLNVEPERIRLFYHGAGNFVANNSTREGKALNRRVEIELRKW
jgi:outer membrane protein OmpA-like peptidoglycan-associated protein